MGNTIYDSNGNIVSVDSPDQQLANAAGTLISPSTEETSASIRAQTDQLTFLTDQLRTARQRSTVSTLNSSTTPLGASATFTGSAEEVKDFADISMFVFADQSSAADGLIIEWSSNGTNWDDNDTFSITPSGTKLFTFGVAARWMRVRYINGTTDQGAFRLQTILHPHNIKPSSHRVSSTISEQNDAELTIAILKGRDSVDGIFKSVDVTAGRLLVSDAPPAPPPGTTPVNRGGFITIAGNTTVDDLYTITNGKMLTIQLLSIRTGENNPGVFEVVELFEDPNGNLSVLNRIDTLFSNGTNFDASQSVSFAGNGVRRILLRARQIGNQNTEIDRQWRGFET